MTEYRRGVVDRVWQKLWHFDPHCADYPVGSFAIKMEKPLDYALCPLCTAFARNHVTADNGLHPSSTHNRL